jgi:hypothetical protein
MKHIRDYKFLKRRKNCHSRKEKNPVGFSTGAEPGTAAQMALTSAVGPPIRVVPVSKATRAALPVVIRTDRPCTVIASRVKRR